MIPVVLLCIWTVVVSVLTTEALVSTNGVFVTTSVEVTILSDLTSEGVTSGQVGRHRAAGNQLANSKKKKPKKQLREILIDNDCPKWKPKLFAQANSDDMSVAIDFCYRESNPVPTTFVCLSSQTENCILLEQPACSHVFKNLTAGNYTINIKPVCRNCFAEIYLKRGCLTTLFTEKLALERHSKVHPRSNETSSTLQPVDYSRTFKICITIIICICASALTVGLAVIVAILVKRFVCTKSRDVKETAQDIEFGPSAENSSTLSKHDLPDNKIPQKEIPKNKIQCDSNRMETKPLLSAVKNVEETSEQGTDKSNTLHSYFNTDTGILWRTQLPPPQSDYEIPYHLLGIHDW